MITQVHLNDGTSIVLYADDILLYREIENVSDYYLLQEDICTLETWILQNYLQLNASKCKYMSISVSDLRYPPTISSYIVTMKQ